MNPNEGQQNDLKLNVEPHTRCNQRPERLEALEEEKLRAEIKQIDTSTGSNILSGQKAQAEILKLQAEARQLNRPLAATPIFWASLTSLIVAIGALIYSWKTGWFDRQTQILALQQQSLKNETEELSRKKDAMIAANQNLSQQLDDKDRKLTDMRNQLSNAVTPLVKIYLDRLNGDTVSTDGLAELIQLASGEHKEIMAQILRRHLEVAASPRAKAQLLLVLYRGTHQREWRQLLFDLLDTASSMLNARGPQGYWDCFDPNWWPRDDVPLLRDKLQDLLKPPFADRNTDLIIANISSSLDDKYGFLPQDRPHYLNTLQAARYSYINGFHMAHSSEILFQLFSPEALVVYYAEARSKSPAQSRIIDRQSGEILLSYGLDASKSDPKHFADWLAKHPDIEQFWMENDFGRLRDALRLRRSPPWAITAGAKATVIAPTSNTSRP